MKRHGLLYHNVHLLLKAYIDGLEVHSPHALALRDLFIAHNTQAARRHGTARL